MSDGNDSYSSGDGGGGGGVEKPQSQNVEQRKSQHNPRSKKRVKKKTTKPKSSQEKFVLISSIKEDHKKAIYSVTFNPFLQAQANPVFATVGGRQLTLYQCNINQDNTTTVLQVLFK